MGKQELSSVAVVFIAFATITTGAFAVTAEVAKQCETLTAKAYPPREIGNPAAGSAKGTATVQRDYFRKCVANGGKVDDKASEKDSKETK
jgi:hypothetical protein